MANSGYRAVALVAVAWTGCDADHDPPVRVEKSLVVEARPEPPRMLPTHPIRVRRTARWRDVDASSCVFFSGPNGRDTQLEGEVEIVRLPNDDVEVRFVDDNATFSGGVRDGVLTLRRLTDYDNFGDAWKTRETIDGRLERGVMRTRYHYEECQVGSPPCPGTCTIDAELTFER